MTGNIKVLILYAKYGQGHLQVSRALKSQFAEIGIKDVRLEDLFASAHPLIEGFTRFMYEQSFTNASYLYGLSYYLTQNMGHDTQLSKWFHSFGMNKLKEIVSDEKPDLVINTFPMLAMPELKKRTGSNIPVFTVMTDFAIHGRWIHSKINKYYVATQDLKSEMINRGVAEEKVSVTGIPIRKMFEKPVEKEQVCKQFDLSPDRNTVLIMASAQTASSELKKLCHAISEEKNLQAAVVCGKKDNLMKEMKKCFMDQPNLRIFGYMENLHQLMGMASCIATKSGGVTLSEAIRSGLPLFLYRPVPGQEKENARYLSKHGAAKIVSNIDELVTEMKNILSPSGENLLKEMKRAVISIQHQNAAETIVEDIIEETDKIRLLSGGQIRIL